ncbi:MAG: helix-turn-helix domain-containing protein [Candidatus Micrarchaeota archaeon]
MEPSGLEKFGLTRNESKVYLALLEEGACGVNTVVRRTGLHAPRVYESLDRLVIKGLASFVYKGKRKEFKATTPKRFKELLNDMEERLSRIMPELLDMEKHAKGEQKATVYVGKEGIRSVMKDVLDDLKPGERYFDFGVSGLFREVMGPFWDYWQNRKRMYGLRSRCIFDERVKKKGTFVKDYFGQARFVSRDYYNPTDTFIFKDKILMCMWNAKPPLAILIHDKETAVGYRRYFNMMWKIARN